jgi:hypothetical protein
MRAAALPLQVEVRKFLAGQGDHGSEACVVRSCQAAVPPGYARLEVCELVDAIWGVDGFDT